MKVLMLPHADRIKNPADGISQVILAYFRHLPAFGIELVAANAGTYDLRAVHAGMTGGECEVCHCHGLYFTADYEAPDWEYRTNAKVIDAVRHAREVTVPSAWVAETFQRDMHFSPHVVPHGVDWADWQHGETCEDFILYNKNRQGDICDASPVAHLARHFPDYWFVSTQPPGMDLPNVKVTGVVPHDQMKVMVQRAGVYLATTKETFGVGILEAMTSGVPVLGYAHGGVLGLVQHGVSGYLAAPGNLDDLAEGLAYCLDHREILGDNGRELARARTWEAACEKVARVYEMALEEEPPTVAVVIPSFMYGEVVGRAARSAVAQTYDLLTDIVVVDDGSEDDGLTRRVVEELVQEDGRVRYVRQDNAGVAVARNAGIAVTRTKYVCCLDADDEIAPDFLYACVAALEADRSLGVAYTGMLLRRPDGRENRGPWPGQCDFDRHLAGQNQVPTCCVFRREAWQRLGGYRQRYAPIGCGTEDAEFWLRMGAAGWGMAKVTDEPLFMYTMGGRTMSTPGYKEVDWRIWHPWILDGKHPLASVATPRRHSHEVRMYDEPLVSVVIPVGPGHERDMVNALDGLEAQTYRQWEAIVVDDTAKMPDFDLTPFPYVKYVRTNDIYYSRDGGKTVNPLKSRGPGFARNRGAELARGRFLLFLDADDWLYPHALNRLLLAFFSSDYEVAIYSDYVGLTHIDGDLAAQLRKAGRLLDLNDQGHAVVSYRAADFEAERAARQPDLQRPYLWCNITTLTPTGWHFEVGGFDEAMPSWEDWDYWIRMARLGKRFVRVEEPLLVYRFYSGNRREEGKALAPELAAYMKEKYGIS